MLTDKIAHTHYSTATRLSFVGCRLWFSEDFTWSFESRKNFGSPENPCPCRSQISFYCQIFGEFLQTFSFTRSKILEQRNDYLISVFKKCHSISFSLISWKPFCFQEPFFQLLNHFLDSVNHNQWNIQISFFVMLQSLS